ncbi:hypothetical protein ABEB36_011600 [Hypothenemus hampei]|uniref:Uncharacterized protein n=1 Tax=Hypothenemus hampei TaxID=57062 RepID=A0ABD1E8D4_HYPHA
MPLNENSNKSSKSQHAATKKLKLTQSKALKSSTKTNIVERTDNSCKDHDHKNNITILVNDSDDVALTEVVIDDTVSFSENRLLEPDVPLKIDTNNNSLNLLPTLCSFSPRSDLGYESVDSPISTSEFDSWDQSVSELFPNLF